MLLLIVILQFFPAKHYGIMEVKKGELKQIGYISVHDTTIWVKFDYEFAREYKLVFTERRASSVLYYVKSDYAQGAIEISDVQILFDLIVCKKDRYHRTFKKRV